MRLQILFLILLILEIYGSITYNRPLFLLTKPLLMPALMLLAYQAGVKDRLLYLALIFSFLGDVFLMFNGTNYFIMGLASFLIAHIFYILLFKADFIFSFTSIVVFGVITAGYLIFLYPTIPSEFRIPVIVYCIVITAMGIAAASRTKDAAYIYILAGAVFFIISDALIAFNKFHSPIRHDALYVMSTYGAAQYLILKGWTKRGSL